MNGLQTAVQGWRDWHWGMASLNLKFKMCFTQYVFEIVLWNVFEHVSREQCLGTYSKLLEIVFCTNNKFLRTSLALFVQHAGTRYDVNHPRDNTHLKYTSCGLVNGTHTYYYILHITHNHIILCFRNPNPFALTCTSRRLDLARGRYFIRKRLR